MISQNRVSSVHYLIIMVFYPLCYVYGMFVDITAIDMSTTDSIVTEQNIM